MLKSYEEGVNRIMVATNFTMTLIEKTIFYTKELPIEMRKDVIDIIMGTSVTDWIDGLTKIYKKYYSLGELERIVEWYESLVGQKNLSISTVISKETEDFMLTLISTRMVSKKKV